MKTDKKKYTYTSYYCIGQKVHFVADDIVTAAEIDSISIYHSKTRNGIGLMYWFKLQDQASKPVMKSIPERYVFESEEALLKNMSFKGKALDAPKDKKNNPAGILKDVTGKVIPFPPVAQVPVKKSRFRLALDKLIAVFKKRKP